MDGCRQISLEQAADWLQQARRIELLCHQKPDGDTLGSAFALRWALEKLGKQVRIVSPDGFPQRYELFWEKEDPAGTTAWEPDLIVAVDVGDLGLLGELEKFYIGRVDLCIDHHRSNSRYARQLLWDPKAAATGELAAQVIACLKAPVDQKIATCIYTALVTDTGGFRFSNTTAQTLRLGAAMMEAGANGYEICRRMFSSKSRGLVALEGTALESMEFLEAGRLAILVIPLELLERTGVQEEELDGISVLPRQVQGVELALIFRQKEEKRWRISVRSGQGIDASDICRQLGGGGHLRAAGCHLSGTLEQAKEQILPIACRALEQAEGGTR